MHYIRERAAPARKSPVCRLNTRYLPLNIPIKFHWPSPYLPLAIPIFSTGHPHLFHWPSPSFPLAIPIFSTGHPHLFHWPSSSARSSDGLRELEKTRPFAAFFLVVLSSPLSLDSGDKMVLLLGIPIFSTGRPHRFHSASPS